MSPRGLVECPALPDFALVALLFDANCKMLFIEHTRCAFDIRHSTFGCTFFSYSIAAASLQLPSSTLLDDVKCKHALPKMRNEESHVDSPFLPLVSRFSRTDVWKDECENAVMPPNVREVQTLRTSERRMFRGVTFACLRYSTVAAFIIATVADVRVRIASPRNSPLKER